MLSRHDMEKELLVSFSELSAAEEASLKLIKYHLCTSEVGRIQLVAAR